MTQPLRITTYVSVLLGLALHGPGLYAISSEEQSRNELDQLRGRIDRLQERLDTDREKESLVTLDLLEIEKQTTALVRERQHSGARLEDLKVEKMQTNARIFALKGQEAVMQQRIGGIVKSSFMQMQNDPLSIALDGGSPTEKLQPMLLSRYIVQARQKSINEIRELKNTYATEVATIQDQEIQISRLVSDLEANARSLSRLEAARQHELQQIRASLADNEERVAEYRLREKELEELLSSLASRKKSSLSPAATPAVQVPENTRAGGDAEYMAPKLVGGFGSNQGKLRMPVKGKIVKRFGQIRPESGLKWDGVMVGVSEGQSVNAIFQGEVVFSDWFGSYGQLLVLDHGGGYMSIYGHNQILNVELGSPVMAGDQIALAGVTGGLEEPGLYFEIRYNGMPTDPLKWCRL